MLIRFSAFAALVTLLLNACIERCGLNLDLGDLPLTDASRAFLPYNSDDILTFVDQDGQTHQLRSEQGLQSFIQELPVRTLCTNVYNAWQYEYYITETEEIHFKNEADEAIFSCALRTSFESESDTNSDAVAIFDVFRVYSRLWFQSNAPIAIITEVREGEPSATFREKLEAGRMVGDTTLYGREFADVIQGGNGNGQSIYYNQQLGVLAITLDEDNYLVLDN